MTGPEIIRADRLATITGGVSPGMEKFTAALANMLSGRLPHLKEMLANQASLVAEKVPGGKVKVYLPNKPEFHVTSTPAILKHLFKDGLPPH